MSLNPVVETLHTNFRDLRRAIESRMKTMQLLESSGERVELAQSIDQLQQAVRQAKSLHLEYTKKLQARELMWEQHQLKPSTTELHVMDDEVGESEKLADEPIKPHSVSRRAARTGAAYANQYIMVQIVNHLASVGHADAAAAVVDARPDLVDLVDLELLSELFGLTNSITSRNFEPALKWCRKNRAALRKQSSPLEFELKLLDFVTHRQTDSLQSLLASAEDNATQKTRAEAVVRVLYGRVRIDPQTDKQTDAAEECGVWPASEVSIELERAYRQIHHLPTSNELLQNVMLGSAVLKTKTCHAVHEGLVEPITPVSVIKQQQLLPIVQHRASECPACVPWMKPVVQTAPLASYTKSSIPADLLMLPSGFVLSLGVIEEYMRQWPDVYSAGKVYDLDGSCVRVDDMKVVFSI